MMTVVWVLVAIIYWTQTLCFTYILFSPDQTTFQSRFYYPAVKMKEVTLRELKLRYLQLWNKTFTKVDGIFP